MEDSAEEDSVEVADWAEGGSAEAEDLEVVGLAEVGSEAAG